MLLVTPYVQGLRISHTVVHGLAPVIAHAVGLHCYVQVIMTTTGKNYCVPAASTTERFLKEEKN